MGWANEVSDFLLLWGENIKGYKCWFVWVGTKSHMTSLMGKNRFKIFVHLKYLKNDIS